jgi:hypothetical protein
MHIGKLGLARRLAPAHEEMMAVLDIVRRAAIELISTRARTAIGLAS